MKTSCLPLLLAVWPIFCFQTAAHAQTDGVLSASTLPVTQQTLSAPAPAFEQVLAHVYEENPQLKSEREAVKILDERVSQANAGFRPSLSVTGEIGAARVSENEQAWRYGQDRNLGLVAIQPIFNGTTISQRDSAKSRVMAGRAHLLATEQTVLLNIITAWLDVCEKQKLLDLTEESMKLTDGFTDATRQRLQAGDSTQTDLAVAESRAADASARYALANAAREISRISYERLVGAPPQGLDFPRLPLDLPHNNDEAVDLAKTNPALQQAGYELEATENDIATADSSLLPYIYLKGSMSDERAADLGLARLRTDAITINATIPLYQGGAEYSRIREAKLAHEKSRIDMINTGRSVTEQARQSWNNYRAAFAVIEASNHASQSARKALDGIQEEHSRGTRTLTEVLDAQAQWLNAQITEVQAEKNLRLEAYRLLAAIGRLTAKGLNLPTRIYDPVPHYNDVTTRWYDTDTEDFHYSHSQ